MGFEINLFSQISESQFMEAQFSSKPVCFSSCSND
jgi:hypothetical protein